MAITKINGARQIQDGTIRNEQIAEDAAIALSKLAETVIQADGGQAFTADQSMGGNRLTNVATPTDANDAANKLYVDSIRQGLDVKDSVRVATTGPITLSGLQTVDGVALAAGDRVLVKDQADATTNGIYVAAAGGWARAADADSNEELTAGAFTFVSEGAVNGDNGFVLVTDDPVTLGTSDLSFVQFSGAGSIIAGDGLTRTGNRIDVAAGDDSLTVGGDNVVVKRDAAGAVGLTAAGLRVEVDGTSIERSGNALRVAAGAAGGGLGYTDGALNVNVGDGVEISGDSVAVKLDGTSLQRSGAGLRVNFDKFIVREAPAGAIDGANTAFTLSQTPIAGKEEVFLNGLLQEPGAGNDYTIAGTTITMTQAPLAGERLRVNYLAV